MGLIGRIRQNDLGHLTAPRARVPDVPLHGNEWERAMATIERRIDLDIDANQAWAVLRDFGNAARVFAGVLTDCQRLGSTRVVTFSGGHSVTERLITLDDRRRRLVYAVLDGAFSHHCASMQIEQREGGCAFVWVSDFIPDRAADMVQPLVEAGCEALQRNLPRLVADATQGVSGMRV